MKKDIYQLFTKYSLNLPRGTIDYNSKDRLFNALIDYWKNVRPTDYEDESGWFDTGVLEDGHMQGACSLNTYTALLLSEFYDNVYDNKRHIINANILTDWLDIGEHPQKINKYYPGGHAIPILAANFYNNAASIIAFAIKRTNGEHIDDWAIHYLKAADELVPNCKHIKSAFYAVKQVSKHIKKKNEQKRLEQERKNLEQIRSERLRKKQCLTCGAPLGFFDKLTGVKECNACQRK